MKPARGDRSRAARDRRWTARAQIAVLISGTGAVVAALLVARSVGLAAAIALTAAELPLIWLAIAGRRAGGSPTTAPFERGFDDAAIGMLMLSREMRVLRVNAAVCSLLARDREELVGRSILDFTHQDDIQQSIDWTDARFGGLDPAPLVKRYIRPDGSLVDATVVSAVVEPDDGEPYFFSQLQDVTEQRRAERQKAAIADLGRRALECTDVVAMIEEAMELVRESLGTANCVTNRRLASGEIRNVAIAGDVVLFSIPPGRPSQTAYTLGVSGPVISNDLSAESRFSVPATVLEHDMYRGLSVRVAERSGSCHAILAQRRREARPFTNGDGRFLEAVAYVIAGAVDRSATEETLRRRALEDPLTGLGNRALLANRLESELRHARRVGDRVCLLTLDLDRFKAVNDTLGHTVGDTLLRQVAARLSACVREEDLVSHPGGDEFAAVCTRAVTDDAIGVVAQRLVDAVVEPFAVAGREVFLTASVGLAVNDGGDETAEALLRDADAAMYRAKELGGGRYETFDLSLRHRLVERMTIEADLRHAIERDQLELYYQPIIDLADERPVGFEALLRWHHPDRGLVGPGEFIHIAEETGMIVPIGDWVLRSVADQLSRWPDTIHVSANVSALQIGPGLVADVEALLADHRLAPDRLVLEITESLVLDPRVRPVVAGLRALGVQLALDDFGTGYSSLGSIQHFPLDLVKLDRALVSSLPGGRGVAVVRAAVELGHALGVAVIAEGIEDRVQLESLRELGCRLGQGFLFAKPMPAHDAERLLIDSGHRAPRADEQAA